jgi:multisubunit Na+/H+ antiporter MnhE subunit
LVSEVADLAVGAGILTFTLAPFALPALALIALVAVALLIPALAVALLLAPFLVARRWWRSRDRSPGATRLARSGGGDRASETVRYELDVRGGRGA